MLSWIKKNGLLLYAHVFFMINTLGFPAPLNFTNFITIGGVKSYFSKKQLVSFIIFFCLSCLYFLIHYINGIELVFYLKTFLYLHFLFFSISITYSYLRKNKEKIEWAFRIVSISNAILFLIAIVLLLTPYQNILWKTHNFVVEGDVFLRYKALTYEPSYYALLVSPLVIYFFYKLFITPSIKNIFFFSITILPVVFTFSFGFVGAFVISVLTTIIAVLLFFKQIKKIFFYPLILSALVGFGVMSTNNFISERVEGLLDGEDTSIKGRTTDSFYLAHQMANHKSLLFGIGLGQIKIIGEKYIREYYVYEKDQWPTVALPNSAAETLAIYGVVGLLIRLLFQLFLFVYFKVYRNYFSLTLFIFIFIYQLMGSYITSTLEYTIWILAILPIFKEFEIKAVSKLTLI